MTRMLTRLTLLPLLAVSLLAAGCSDSSGPLAPAGPDIGKASFSATAVKPKVPPTGVEPIDEIVRPLTDFSLPIP